MDLWQRERALISRQRKLCLLSHLHAIILGQNKCHNRMYVRDGWLVLDPVPVLRMETSLPATKTTTEWKRKKRWGNVSANIWHVHVMHVTTGDMWHMSRNSKLCNIYKIHNSQNDQDRAYTLYSQFSLWIFIWIMCCSRTSHTLLEKSREIDAHISFVVTHLFLPLRSKSVCSENRTPSKSVVVLGLD